MAVIMATNYAVQGIILKVFCCTLVKEKMLPAHFLFLVKEKKKKPISLITLFPIFSDVFIHLTDYSNFYVIY